MTQLSDQHYYDKNVRSDKLKLLYNEPFHPVIYTLCAALTYAAIVWQQVDKKLLFIWLGLIGFFSIVRIILFIAFITKKPQGNDVLKWEKPYFVTLILSALVWGVGLIWLMYDLPFTYQLVGCLFLTGLAGSAVSTYSIIRYIAISTLLVILAPVTIFLLLSGEAIQIWIALTAGLFIAGGFKSSRTYSNVLHHSLILTYALSKAKEEAEKLARIDMLTGINNRRAFTELSKIQIDYCKRHEQPISAIILDVDRFKNINDKYGHASGDVALQHLSIILQNLTRTSDVIGRIGGEEFAILMTSTNTEDATAVAEKLRRWIEDNPVQIKDNYFTMTVSVGISSDESYDLETLLKKADKAMYKAKEAGRNQVVCY